MITIHISTTVIMIMDTVKMNKISFIFALFLSACTISPGMQNIQTGFSSDEIYIESLGKSLKVINVNELEADEIVFSENLEDYIVAPGDILTFIVWGLDDVFPVNAAFQMNNPLNARTVDNDGNIFFPYVGTVKVEGMTVKEIKV